jgi:hypothetical protein
VSKNPEKKTKSAFKIEVDFSLKIPKHKYIASVLDANFDYSEHTLFGVPTCSYLLESVVAQKGDIKALLNADRSKGLPEDKVHKVFTQLIVAIDHLH